MGKKGKGKAEEETQSAVQVLATAADGSKTLLTEEKTTSVGNSNRSHSFQVNSELFQSSTNVPGSERVPHARQIEAQRVGLMNIRERLLAFPVVPKDLTDSQLVEYMVCVNYQTDKSVEYIVAAYKAKYELPLLFTNRDPFTPEAQLFWEVVNIVFFPKKAEDGSNFIYFGLANPDPKIFNTVWNFKMFLMVTEIITRVCGLVPFTTFILDGHGMSLGHVPISQLRFFKRAIGYLQENSLLNMKKIHFVNASSTVERTYSLMRPFLGNNVTENLRFYADSKMLAAPIGPVDPAFVTPELGGTLPSTIPELKDEAEHAREFAKQSRYFIQVLEREARLTEYPTRLPLHRPCNNCIRRELLTTETGVRIFRQSQSAVDSRTDNMSGQWKLTAEEEYKRCLEVRESEVKMIQEWLAKQPHLPPMSENHIIVYLRACKFSLEKTKEAIDLNFTIRTRYPEFFSDRRLDTIPKTVKNLDVALMPERDRSGNVVLCYRLKPMDISEWNYGEFVKYSMMSQDACNWELGSAPGYVFIHDIKNLTFSQIIGSPISQIAAALKYSQEGSACSIRGIHIMNGGSIFEKLFMVIKPFLNQDVIDVMKVHSNYDDLIKAVGAQAVPKDYGGSGPSIAEGTEEMLKLMGKYAKALVEEESQRVDEKKRPEGSKAGDFGIQGSFRKIEVD